MQQCNVRTFPQQLFLSRNSSDVLSPCPARLGFPGTMCCIVHPYIALGAESHLGSGRVTNLARVKSLRSGKVESVTLGRVEHIQKVCLASYWSTSLTLTPASWHLPHRLTLASFKAPPSHFQITSYIHMSHDELKDKHATNGQPTHTSCTNLSTVASFQPHGS